MKVFLSAVYQETNSFSPCRTDLDHFRRGKLLEGSAVPAEIGDTNLELAGMADEIRRRFPGATLEYGLYAWSIASGPVTDTAFADLAERTLAPLRHALPVDAVLFSMHGSMGRETGDDCEGELLTLVRRLVGPGVPIAVTLDSHAAISRVMLQQADLICGYHTYPHVDMADTGRRTVAALSAWLDGNRRERVVARRWPAVIPVDNAQTDSGPMAGLMAELAELASQPVVLSVSAFCTHPWFDTPDHGVTLLAYTTPESAITVGEHLDRSLGHLWARREEFLCTGPSPADFFRNLHQWPRPIAAIDAGDVTTAGAPGHSTVMLRAALATPGPVVLLPIVSPATVSESFDRGIDREAEFTIGQGPSVASSNAPLRLRATVRRLESGPLGISGAAFGGVSLAIGPRALLQAGPLHVLALSHASLFHDPELWRSLGVDPAVADVIVQKSHKLFRPAYASIVGSVVTVDTPGCTDRQLARLPYRHRRRPVFPLDPVALPPATNLQ